MMKQSQPCAGELKSNWSMNRNHKTLLLGSFIASFFLHLAALGLLQKVSLWFSACHKVKDCSECFSLTDKYKKDRILQAAFKIVPEEKDLSHPTAYFQTEYLDAWVLKTPLILQKPPYSTPTFHEPLSFNPLDQHLIQKHLLL